MATLIQPARARGPQRRCRVLALAAIVFLCTACASQSVTHLQSRRVTPEVVCPDDRIRSCEVIGGNRFQKRYGRCSCLKR